MKNSLLLAISVISALILLPEIALAADKYVAIAVADDAPKYGTGSGATKEEAIDAAYAACKKSYGKDCGYHYWAKSSNHVVMMYCEKVIAGEKVSGGLGAHHSSSLEKAKTKALRSIKKFLLINTYDHLEPGDCRVVATYSGGTFTRY